MHKHFGFSHKDLAFSANEKIFRKSEKKAFMLNQISKGKYYLKIETLEKSIDISGYKIEIIK